MTTNPKDECVECAYITDNECTYCGEPVCEDCAELHYDYTHPDEEI